MTAATVPNPTHLLGDVGGTHCRLALSDGRSIGPITAVKTKDYPSIESLLSEYIAANPAAAGCDFLLSFGIKHGVDGYYALDAGYKDAPWRFRPDDVCAATGLKSMRVVHDFYAMGLSVLSAQNVFKPLRAGTGGEGAKLSLILGPGSGVGHALVDVARREVYDTHGAHMPPTFTTQEQWEIARLVMESRGGARSLIAEDILGGVALYRFYTACCAVFGHERTCSDVEALLPAHAAGDAGATACLSAWALWLGQYTNSLVTGAFAHQGVYLCGGVTEKLLAADAFDVDAFLNGFHQNMVAIVDRDLRATPVYVPATEHTALYGLMELIEQKQGGGE